MKGWWIMKIIGYQVYFTRSGCDEYGEFRTLKEFEEWIDNPHLLSKRDSPKLWHGSKEEIAKHESNPYEHPYTAGAYEAWKYLKSSERK